MTTVRGAEVLEEPARMAAESMRAWLRDFEGYCGTLVLVDEVGMTARFFTFWADERAEERSRPGRVRMREQMASTAGVELEGNEVYSVAFTDQLDSLS